MQKRWRDTTPAIKSGHNAKWYAKSAERIRLKTKARYERLVAEGICVRCAKTPTKLFKYCLKCRKKMSV